MARDVIMPALGMAQETGVIVAWLKKPGEAVKAGEPLFEVETDKAVMAVEADADGVLSDLRRREGDEVPVGEVIARIAPQGEAAAEPAPRAEVAALALPGGPPEPVPSPSPAPNGDPDAAKGASRRDEGRILASPKARRLAAERGIDLRALVGAGVPQPFHAADLDRVPARRAGPAATANRVVARADARAFLAFRALLAEEGTAPADAAVWAAFAAASLREAAGGGASPLVVAVERPGSAAASFGDPDLGALAQVRETDDRSSPALILRDLTGRRVTEVALARDAGPSLCVAGGEGGYSLSLAWSDASLSEDQAIALLEAFAARIEQPLRHLL